MVTFRTEIILTESIGFYICKDAILWKERIEAKNPWPMTMRINGLEPRRESSYYMIVRSREGTPNARSPIPDPISDAWVDSG